LNKYNADKSHGNFVIVSKKLYPGNNMHYGDYSNITSLE